MTLSFSKHQWFVERTCCSIFFFVTSLIIVLEWETPDLGAGPRCGQNCLCRTNLITLPVLSRVLVHGSPTYTALFHGPREGQRCQGGWVPALSPEDRQPSHECGVLSQTLAFLYVGHTLSSFPPLFFPVPFPVHLSGKVRMDKPHARLRKVLGTPSGGHLTCPPAHGSCS